MIFDKPKVISLSPHRLANKQNTTTDNDNNKRQRQRKRSGTQATNNYNDHPTIQESHLQKKHFL